MEYPLWHKGDDVGSIDVNIENIYAHFTAKSSIKTDDIFRCYGEVKGRDAVLIGVMEPCDDYLIIDRKLTLMFLHENGAYPDFPERFFLQGINEEKPDMIRTGDALIDEIIKSGKAHVRDEKILCEFNKEKENPLNFALTICRTEMIDGKTYSVLDIKDIKKGRE